MTAFPHVRVLFSIILAISLSASSFAVASASQWEYFDIAADLSPEEFDRNSDFYVKLLSGGCDPQPDENGRSVSICTVPFRKGDKFLRARVKKYGGFNENGDPEFDDKAIAKQLEAIINGREDLKNTYKRLHILTEIIDLGGGEASEPEEEKQDTAKVPETDEPEASEVEPTQVAKENSPPTFEISDAQREGITNAVGDLFSQAKKKWEEWRGLFEQAKQETASNHTDAIADRPVPHVAVPSLDAHAVDGPVASDSEPSEREVAAESQRDKILKSHGVLDKLEKLDEKKKTQLAKALESLKPLDEETDVEELNNYYDRVYAALHLYTENDGEIRELIDAMLEGSEHLAQMQDNKKALADIHQVRGASLQELRDSVDGEGSERQKAIAKFEIDRRRGGKLVKFYSDWAAARSGTALNEVESIRSQLEGNDVAGAAKAIASRFSQLTKPVRERLLAQAMAMENNSEIPQSEREFLAQLRRSLEVVNAYWDERRGENGKVLGHAAAKKKALENIEGDNGLATQVLDVLGEKLDRNQKRLALLKQAFDSSKPENVRRDAMRRLRKIYKGAENNVLDYIAQLDRELENMDLSKEYRDLLKLRRNQWTSVIARQDQNGNWYLPLRAEEGIASAQVGEEIQISPQGAVFGAGSDDIGSLVRNLNQGGRNLHNVTIDSGVGNYSEPTKYFEPPKNLYAQSNEGIQNVAHAEWLKELQAQQQARRKALEAAQQQAQASSEPNRQVAQSKGLGKVKSAGAGGDPFAFLNDMLKLNGEGETEAGETDSEASTGTSVINQPVSSREEIWNAQVNTIPKNVDKGFLYIRHSSEPEVPAWGQFNQQLSASQNPHAFTMKQDYSARKRRDGKVPRSKIMQEYYVQNRNAVFHPSSLIEYTRKANGEWVWRVHAGRANIQKRLEAERQTALAQGQQKGPKRAVAQSSAKKSFLKLSGEEQLSWGDVQQHFGNANGWVMLSTTGCTPCDLYEPDFNQIASNDRSGNRYLYSKKQNGGKHDQLKQALKKKFGQFGYPAFIRIQNGAPISVSTKPFWVR